MNLVLDKSFSTLLTSYSGQNGAGSEHGIQFRRHARGIFLPGGAAQTCLNYFTWRC